MLNQPNPFANRFVLVEGKPGLARSTE